MNDQARSIEIGTEVWFHSRDFKSNYETARHGFVNGPGAQPNLLNLTIFPSSMDVIDREAPLITRRNVIVLQDYPKQWPMEDFAVMSVSALAHKTDGTMHGGKRPLVEAGVVTIVEPYATYVMGIDDAAELKRRQAIDEIAMKDLYDRREQDFKERGLLPMVRPQIDQVTSPEQVAKVLSKTNNTVAEQMAEDPKPAHSALHPMLHKLITQHPAWARTFDSIKGLKIEADGDFISFTNSAGLLVCHITHKLTEPDMGLSLSINAQKGTFPRLVKGVKDKDDIRRMIVLAGSIVNATMKCTKIADVVKKTAKVLEDEFQNAQA